MIQTRHGTIIAIIQQTTWRILSRSAGNLHYPSTLRHREGAVEWLKMAARLSAMRIETWQKTKAELKSGELTKENSQERNMKMIFSQSYGPSRVPSRPKRVTDLKRRRQFDDITPTTKTLSGVRTRAFHALFRKRPGFTLR